MWNEINQVLFFKFWIGGQTTDLTKGATSVFKMALLKGSFKVHMYRRFEIALRNMSKFTCKRRTFSLAVILIIFFLWITILQVFYVNDFRNQVVFMSNDESIAKDQDAVQNNSLDAYEILQNITRHNELQTIRNQHSFGPLTNDSVVIVVQVHTRITYLRHLIVSLAQAKDISKTLLIFSHDYYDEDINYLVQRIDFCKVLQIFYPYSVQTHEHEFPGEDPNDCPRNLKRDQAIIRKCNNALYPDLYGHYREAKFTQTKHHWWWKANRVFDQLEVTRHHTGLVLFLEEDHYVAEDFLHLLALMQKRANELCAKCNILSLGTYLKTFSKYIPENMNQVTTATWMSSKHNMGFALERNAWRKIAQCSKHFCTYDDYNWDWTLQYVSQECLPKNLFVMLPTAPRVFHIGKCGLHHGQQNCDPNESIAKIQQIFQKAAESHQFYPKELIAAPDSFSKTFELLEANGGWSDIRDHNLCMKFTKIER